MKNQHTSTLFASVLLFVLLLAVALAQSPGTDNKEPLDLTGVWKTAQHERVLIEQTGQSGQTVEALFSSGGTCPVGARMRPYFFEGNLNGNSLTGNMVVCTSDPKLVTDCDPSLHIESTYETTFEATAAPDKIEGKYFSEGIAYGVDDAGHYINCHRDSRANTKQPFSLTRSCGENCKEILWPNPRAAKLWEGLFAGMAAPTVSPVAKIALVRFLSNCEGEKLLKDLTDMPCPESWHAPAGCKMGSKIRFKLQFQDHIYDRDDKGKIIPDSDHAGETQVDIGDGKPGLAIPFPNPDPEQTDPQVLENFVYIVKIRNQADSAGFGNSFPGGGGVDCPGFNYTFSDGSSSMAATIHHELLHIWFMNRNNQDYSHTGHEGPGKNCGDYDPKFLARIKDFYRAMDGLEACEKTNP